MFNHQTPTKPDLQELLTEDFFAGVFGQIHPGRSDLFHQSAWVTLPETNSSPVKMNGWNTTFLLGRPIVQVINILEIQDWLVGG